MCETIFGDSFKYETDPTKGYTMWFFDAINPNNAITTAYRNAGTFPHSATNTNDKCHLDWNHKNGPPSANPVTFTECHPWDSSSCCRYDTVATAANLKVLNGEKYRWDRCGPMSPACERFFVQEGCFYECDPNIGIYRKFRTEAAGGNFNATDPTMNPWQVVGVPIKASYCDAWYRACKKDYFCGRGNFFDCSTETITPVGGTTSTSSSTASGSSNPSSAAVVINMFNSGSGSGSCPSA